MINVYKEKGRITFLQHLQRNRQHVFNLHTKLSVLNRDVMQIVRAICACGVVANCMHGVRIDSNKPTGTKHWGAKCRSHPFQEKLSCTCEHTTNQLAFGVGSIIAPGAAVRAVD